MSKSNFFLSSIFRYIDKLIEALTYRDSAALSYVEKGILFYWYLQTVIDSN